MGLLKKEITNALNSLGWMVYHLFLAYLVMFICRLVYFFDNYSYFKDIDFISFVNLNFHAFRFDLTGILYLNSIIILLFLFPIHLKENRGYYQFTRWLFVAVNMVGVVLNLMDSVYFPYTNRRTTSSVFQQFQHETNLGKIIGIEFLHNWYLVILALLIGFGLYRLFHVPVNRKYKLSVMPAYYLFRTLILVGVIPLVVFGIRGGIGRDVRPITLNDANRFVDNPMETSIILNTPFTMIRTISKKAFVVPEYFTDEKKMMSYYTPVHIPADTVRFRPKNVVILILESFGAEYYGFCNKTLEGGKYKGFTPFLDSLVTKSLVFENSFSSGRKSIDAMPSVLSSIPRLADPIIASTASLNDMSSVASLLAPKGYYSAFFHGAWNGSMGFNAFSKSVGFKHYFGRTEYNNDKDYDGYWAIWDEEFLQFFANQMGRFPQPFVSGVFTATSHHPFQIPDRYKNRFKGGNLPIYKCIQYTDYSLRCFFATASKMPWYQNTLFVIVGDHVNQSDHDVYRTSLGLFRVPIIFFTPSGELRGMRKGISQQIDIMPTILGYLGYDKPYLAFGHDLLSTPDDETYAVNGLDDTYQLIKGDYLLQFDGQHVMGYYNYKTDPLLQNNLVNKMNYDDRLNLLKSFIQQYMYRLSHNELIQK